MINTPLNERAIVFSNSISLIDKLIPLTYTRWSLCQSVGQAVTSRNHPLCNCYQMYLET